MARTPEPCGGRAQDLLDHRRCHKFEARNPKLETNPKPQVRRTQTNDQYGCAPVSDFEPLDFELVSNFELRVSDFKSSWLVLGPAVAGGHLPTQSRNMKLQMRNNNRIA
jgi:hypothetical protein